MSQKKAVFDYDDSSSSDTEIDFGVSIKVFFD